MKIHDTSFTNCASFALVAVQCQPVPSNALVRVSLSFGSHRNKEVVERSHKPDVVSREVHSKALSYMALTGRPGARNL